MLDRVRLRNILTRNGGDPNAEFTAGVPLIVYAAKHRFLDQVTHLLSLGADVNLQDYHGESALMYASENGDDEMIQLLQATGEVDVNAQNDDGETSLIKASNLGLASSVSNLLPWGVDVNHMDSHRMTALMYASSNGYVEVVRLLLKTGRTNINIQDMHGSTALTHATNGDHYEIVKLILETGKVDATMISLAPPPPASQADEEDGGGADEEDDYYDSEEDGWRF